MYSSQSTPERGKTWYNGQTIDTNNYGTSVGLEGSVRRFDNTNVAAGSTNPLLTRRDGDDVICRLVRNVSGQTLYPGNAVVYASGQYGKRVDRYSRVNYERIAGIIDDHYGSGGIPNGDLFWIVIKGQVLWTTNLGAATSFVVGDILFALTATTTQGTSGSTGGKPDRYLGTFTVTQTTDGTAASILLGSVGRALSALTTTQTSTSMLVDVQALY